jgi:hypothetical protein
MRNRCSEPSESLDGKGAEARAGPVGRAVVDAVRRGDGDVPADQRRRTHATVDQRRADLGPLLCEDAVDEFLDHLRRGARFELTKERIGLGTRRRGALFGGRFGSDGFAAACDDGGGQRKDAESRGSHDGSSMSVVSRRAYLNRETVSRRASIRDARSLQRGVPPQYHPMDSSTQPQPCPSTARQSRCTTRPSSHQIATSPSHRPR